MYSREINGLIDKMEMAIGHNQFCADCRKSFHASSDGCPLCGSMRTSSLIEETPTGEIIDEATYLKELLANFEKFGVCLVRSEDGTHFEPIFNHQSCPWPREEINNE